MKIYILGNLGSGKSFLATKISEKFKIPHFDLDNLFWKRKYTVKRKEEKIKVTLSNIIKNNKSWVIEGIFTSFVSQAIDNADKIIWIDINFDLIYLKRLLLRELGKVKKAQKSLQDILRSITIVKSYKNKKGLYHQQKALLKKYKKNFTLIKSRTELKKIHKDLSKLYT